MRRPENPNNVPGLLLVLRRLAHALMGRSVPQGWSLVRIRDDEARDAISVSRAGQLDALLFKHSILVHIDDTHAPYPIPSPVLGTALHLMLRNGGNWPSRAQEVHVEAQWVDGSCYSAEEIIIPWLWPGQVVEREFNSFVHGVRVAMPD